MNPRAAGALILFLAAIVIGSALLARRSPDAGPKARKERPGESGTLPRSLGEIRNRSRNPETAPDSKAWAALATDLRRQARTDPAALEELGRVLADRSESAALRELAALVLGSLDDPRAEALLRAALKAETDPDLTRLLILALGMSKDRPDVDDRFQLPDTPWVIRTPLGLAVRVNHPIADESLRAEILARLDGPPGVRDAAVKVLLHSVGHADVRRGLTAAFGAETEIAIQAEIGKTLIGWAAGPGAATPEREALVPAILERGMADGSGALRIRTEAGLSALRMSPAEIQSLAPFIDTGDPGMRRWAMTVLAAQAARPQVPERDALQAAFLRVAQGDPEPKMREIAVRSLGVFADRPEAVERIRAALTDAAWHVRAAAATALGRLAKDDGLLESLRSAAQSDPDERVRNAARQAAEMMAARTK